MAVPFRIGVMQLTMEPLDEMLASARVMDEAGMDTIWLAEAYPWWRKHGMEARSSTVVSALMARETKRLTIGWGIISPFTRHPVQVAMDARVVQEAAGPGRFILGFGTSKIFLNNAGMQTSKTLGPMRDAVEIVRGVLGGEAFEYTGSTWNANVPALQAEAHAPRERAAGLRRGDGAEDAGARRRDRRRLPDAVDHDAGVRPLHARERRGRHRHRLHGRRLDPRVRPRRGPRRRARDRRHVSREQGAEHPGLGRHAARPRGHRAGRDPPRRRGDGAGRPPRREGEGHATRCSTSASRSPEQSGLGRRALAAIERVDARCDRGDDARDVHRLGTLVLEWRADRSSHTIREQSRLVSSRAGHSVEPAAATLVDRRRAGDLDGGFEAWAAAGRMKIDRDRLVDTASQLVNVHSFTGDEERMADLMLAIFDGMGLQVQRQQVEDNRANALGTWAGAGGGPSLMFNGHMDTSYSGREPWLRDVPGLPAAGVRARRPPLRARHLEHEGRARLLRRGRARAAGCRRAAARRRADRRRQRRDREDAVRRRDGRASTAATPPARAISSRTAASPTCACSASRPRARSCSATSARSGCASACTATSSTRRSARGSATRTRSCACTR